MKKTFLFIISFIVILNLSSCTTAKTKVELSKSGEDVQAIEIYNSEQKYYEGNISEFLNGNEPIFTLGKEEHSTFLDALCNLEFGEEKVYFPIPMDGGYDYEGYIIAIIYTDDAYDIIAEKGSYSYFVNKKGEGRHKYEHSDYCGETPWSDFVEQYIK